MILSSFLVADNVLSAKVFLTLEILSVVFLVNVREKCRAGLLSDFFYLQY